MKRLVNNFKRAIGSRILNPRLAYTHLFVDDTVMNSMIHVQNPFSFFWPDGEPIATASIEARNSSGILVKKAVYSIQPFGTLALDLHLFLADLPEKPAFGTVTIDLIPPKNYRHFLRQITNDVPIIASPFWVRFSSPINSSQGYSHSIEADHAKTRGVPAFISRYFTSQELGGPWESNRLVSLYNSNFARGVIVNHSGETSEVTMSWRNQLGQDICQEERNLPPRGVLILDTPKNFNGDVYLSVNQLPTPNAKPYVFVFEHSGEFGFTHG